MIRYAITFPGVLDDEQALWIGREIEAAADSPRWRDIVLQEGGTIARVNTVRVPSVRTKNAQKRLR